MSRLDLSALEVILPNNSVRSTDLQTSGGSEPGIIKAQIPIRTDFGLERTDTPAVDTDGKFLYHFHTAGTMKYVAALLMESGTSTDVDFDIKVFNDSNPSGITILSSMINVVHGSGDRTPVAGSLSITSFAANDVLYAFIDTVTSSTGAQGPIVKGYVNELPYT